MLNKIADGIWILPHQEATDRPALGYIQGDKLSLQVDAGNSRKHHLLMASALKQASLPAPDLLALTHFHWDHTFAMHAFSGLTFAGKATQERLHAMRQWRWTPAAMAARIAAGEDMLFCHDMILKEYADLSQIRVVPADIAFDGRLTLDLGNCPVHLIPLENSHSEDCVVIHVPRQQVLFLGDIHYEDLLAQPPRYYPDKHRSLIAALENLAFDLCVPGHQPPMTRRQLFEDLAQI